LALCICNWGTLISFRFLYILLNIILFLYACILSIVILWSGNVTLQSCCVKFTKWMFLRNINCLVIYLAMNCSIQRISQTFICKDQRLSWELFDTWRDQMFPLLKIKNIFYWSSWSFLTNGSYKHIHKIKPTVISEKTS
jgi:hypothetical protein